MPVLSTVGAASLRAFGAFRQGTAAGFISATGGTITTSGNYKYHTFTSSGTFSVSAAPSGRTIDFILVAGGGGSDSEAGGGAGGVVEKLAQTIAAGSYAVTIGTGGAVQASGSNSLFKGDTALGGGRGNASGVGFSGGSGGGGTSGGTALQPTSASGGYGYAGGVKGGGGAGGAASGDTAGDAYTSSTFNDSYGEGGNVDETAAGVGTNGKGGDYNRDTGTGYAGANGVLVVRYLYQ